MSSPPVGSMYLYDNITPPLLDNSYQLSMVTNVTFDGTQQTLQPATGFFDIDGPRFSLSATEVGAVFPPNNGHGGFDEAIPHIALVRRTLPWERALTSQPVVDRHAHSRDRRSCLAESKSAAGWPAPTTGRRPGWRCCFSRKASMCSTTMCRCRTPFPRMSTSVSILPRALPATRCRLHLAGVIVDAFARRVDALGARPAGQR